MKSKLQAIASGLLLGSLFGFGLYMGFTVPEVQISHSTGECVKVINFKESHNYTCDNLPSRYDHVWVK